MPPENPATDVTPAEDAAVHTQATPSYAQATTAYEAPAYEAIDERDDWQEEELPRRPRRRLLGAGGNPIFLALLGVLLIACGFIGGVLIEKGQAGSSSSTSTAAASFASRFRALGGSAGASTSTGSSSSSSSGSSPFGAGFTRPTAGTVAYLEGSTLYVTNSEGNTVKVTTSAGTSVTKTVKSSVGAVHPGETVTVTGSTGTGGTVSAESISVGSSGGGLAALFGGSRGGTSGASTSGKEPSLFGSGG